MSEAVCGTCFHHCRLQEGQPGLCRARGCRGGEVVSLNYGRLTSLALDPIEKKPLARFYPGSRVLSAGSYGCNLSCPFCQNAEISCAGEADVPWQAVTPAELADMAERLRPQGNIGVAYTYNEPMIGWEFVRDAAREVRRRGMKNVVVTNGTASAEALAAILPYTDAFNIDLKGFTAEWYRRLGGDLAAVQAFIRQAVPAAHVELTTLIVPGENDTEAEMRQLSAWVASLDRGIPLHITRFFPRHRMADRAPTDLAVLRRLQAAARENLDFVYLGNV